MHHPVLCKTHLLHRSLVVLLATNVPIDVASPPAADGHGRQQAASAERREVLLCVGAGAVLFKALWASRNRKRESRCATYLVRLAEVGDSPSHRLVPLGEQPRHVPQTSLRVVDRDVGVDVVHGQVSVDRRLRRIQQAEHTKQEPKRGSAGGLSRLMWVLSTAKKR